MISPDPILLDLPDEILGERVLIRPYHAGDGQALWEAIDESRQHLLPWLPWAITGHQSVNDSEVMARQAHARWVQREDLTLGIWDKRSGRLLGGTGLHRFDWRIRSFEIGYWIRKSEEGKGYVTETVRLLCEFAFQRLDAKRVFIRCASDNPRSAAIPPRVGFMLEGTLRRTIRDADGHLHDALVFGILREEWEAISTEPSPMPES